MNEQQRLAAESLSFFELTAAKYTAYAVCKLIAQCLTSEERPIDRTAMFVACLGAMLGESEIETDQIADIYNELEQLWKQAAKRELNARDMTLPDYLKSTVEL